MLFAAQVGDLFAGGRSSCKGYTKIFAAQFVTLSRVELPVTKTLGKFCKSFLSSILAAGLGDLHVI